MRSIPLSNHFLHFFIYPAIDQFLIKYIPILAFQYLTHPNPLLKREGKKRKNSFFLFILLLAFLRFLLFGISFIFSSKREGQSVSAKATPRQAG